MKKMFAFCLLIFSASLAFGSDFGPPKTTDGIQFECVLPVFTDAVTAPFEIEYLSVTEIEKENRVASFTAPEKPLFTVNFQKSAQLHLDPGLKRSNYYILNISSRNKLPSLSPGKVTNYFKGYSKARWCRKC